MGRGQRRLVALVASAMALVVVAPAAHAAQQSQVVAAVPTKGSKLAADGKYYLLDALPGDTVTQSIDVINPNKTPVTAVLEAVDALTKDVTGMGFGTPGSPKAVTARWIVISTPLLTLQPAERRAVPFTVHVPPDTLPGQYVAAVSASVPIDAKTKQKNLGANQAGFDMNVQYQRTIAVEVDVPGPRKPELAVTGAEPFATPDGVQLSVHMINRGNAYARGKGVIRIASTNTDFSFDIETFVPGTAITFPMTWTKDVVPGTHNVQVDLQYAESRSGPFTQRTSWNGDIVIAGDLQSRLEAGLQNVRLHPSHKSWWIWLIIAIALVLAAAALRMRRRSRRRPAYVKYRSA